MYGEENIVFTIFYQCKETLFIFIYFVLFIFTYLLLNFRNWDFTFSRFGVSWMQKSGFSQLVFVNHSVINIIKKQIIRLNLVF